MVITCTYNALLLNKTRAKMAAKFLVEKTIIYLVLLLKQGAIYEGVGGQKDNHHDK